MSEAREDRIPADLAFVVRTDGRKFLLWIGGLTLAGYLLLCCVAGSVLYLVARDLDGAASGVLALVLVPLIAAGGLLALPLLMARHRFIGRGPLLAADQAGIWVRHVGLFSRPIWLPWEAVASVSVKRQLIEELVWIDADPRYPGAPPGTRLPVTTLLSDRSTTEIVTALAQLAAGRTRFSSSSTRQDPRDQGLATRHAGDSASWSLITAISGGVRWFRRSFPRRRCGWWPRRSG